MRKLILVVLFSIAGTTHAQQLYKCSDGKGGNVYQQTQCASDKQSKGVVKYQRAADAPRNYGQHDLYQPPENEAYQNSRAAQTQYQPVSKPDPVTRKADGYVRCTQGNGTTYIASGRCRTQTTTVPVPQQAGMVRDIRTGQQTFMVPGGGNGMIDPSTGRRHELISPPPTAQVRTQDTGQPVSRAEVCQQAMAAASNYNRTIDSIRAAEKRIADACGG
jgi:hypothetical protein